MTQLEYQIFISHLNSTWSNYSRCLISKQYNYFILRYRHIPMCATYATSGTGHRHLSHFMNIDQMT